LAISEEGRCGVARRADRFVSGLVLAGGERLSSARDLHPFRRVVATARACRFDQLIVAVGGAAAAVAGVELAGADVILDGGGDNASSSLVTALVHLDPRTDLLVLLQGDQPGVTPATVQTLVDGMGLAALAACGYPSGRGHPLAFARDAFGELSALDGDAEVWTLLDRHADDVVDVPVGAYAPRDLDAWASYKAPVDA